MPGQDWNPEYTYSLNLVQTGRHALEFTLTHQEEGTTHSRDYSRALAMEIPTFGVGDWESFSVSITKEFRDAVTNATSFLYDSNVFSSDHCLAYGYFNALPRDPFQMRAGFISPLGFGTTHLLALLIRIDYDLGFDMLSHLTTVLTQKLVAEWDMNSKAKFPRRLLVVIAGGSQEEQDTRFGGTDMKQIKGVFVDMRFPQRGTGRPSTTATEEQSPQDRQARK
ncbi:hypothetical protein PG987_006449 [Apiospora arundinis]